jgi:hypothetical protein
MNRLLKIFAKCEQDIHKRFGGDAEVLERKGPTRWTPEQWIWVDQRISEFENSDSWATQEEKRTIRIWLGKSVDDYNAKDAVVRSCFEHVVQIVDSFLNSQQHN